MKKTTPKRSVIAAILIVAVIVLSTAYYQSNVQRELDEFTELTLTEASKQQKYSVELLVEYNLEHTKNISANISKLVKNGNIKESDKEVSAYLQQAEMSTAYEYIYIIFDDGTALNSGGEYINIRDTETLAIHENDISSINYFEKSPITGESSIVVSAPVFGDGTEIIGTVIVHVSVDVLRSMLLPGFGGEGVTMVLNNDGTAIAVSDNEYEFMAGENIAHYLGPMDFTGYSDINELDDLSIFQQNEGYLTYEYGGTSHKLKYAVVENTNWMIAMTVPENIIAENAHLIMLNTTLLLIEIVIILLITWLRIIALNKSHLKEVSNIAYYDGLTGLYNEKKFKIEIEKVLKSNKDERYTIVKVDIINFKVANNIFGYDIGNKIIKIIASTSMPKYNRELIFARISADEFLLFSKYNILKDVKNIRKMYEDEVNNKIREVCGRSFKFRYSRYNIPVGETNVNDIINTIDLTHSFSKQQAFDGIYDYEDDLKKQVVHTAYICDIMNGALKDKEFKVYLQPKYNLEDGTICGAEALVRWQRANGKFIYPNEFIHIFEQEGFIMNLDRYMLHNVCQIIKRLKENNKREIPISINFSRMHMLDENYTEEITEIVDSYGVPHHLIEIEMTETSMIENEEEFKKVFLDLHKRGFTLSMDDFGAGYSSLALLTELHFDVIKLDKSLLSETLEKDSSALVIETILNMSKQLNLKTVCEGVETKGQVEFLKMAGCDLAQGYYFAKPMPNEDVEKLL